MSDKTLTSKILDKRFLGPFPDTARKYVNVAVAQLNAWARDADKMRAENVAIHKDLDRALGKIVSRETIITKLHKQNCELRTSKSVLRWLEVQLGEEEG